MKQSQKEFYLLHLTAIMEQFLYMGKQGVGKPLQ